MFLHNPFSTVGVDEAAQPFSLGRLPMYLAWTVVGFGRSWLQTRDLRRFIQGLPAILLAVILALLLLSRDQPVSSQTISGYLERAKAAMAREEYEESEFYYRKLELLAPQDGDVVYGRALLHAQQGNYAEAFRLMESLVADNDKSNDREIHKWLAETVLENDLGIENPLDYAKRHLAAVLENGENDKLARYAHYFFAQIYVRKRDYQSAIEHLQPIASYSNELELLLASLYLQLEPPDQNRARAHATNVVRDLRDEIQRSLDVTVKTYHELAAGLLILEEFENAIRTLEQARTRYNLESTRRRMSRAYVAWSDDESKRHPEDVGGRMKLLEQALNAAPDEPLALNRILEIATSLGPGADEAERRLRQALVDGMAPAILHFSLGSIAAKRGDTEAAMRHFKQSAEHNPHTAVTLNNIAYLMSQSEAADLDQALEMINQAVAMAPTAPPFRDTRGQILVRLGRWSEAIADLEYANSRMKDLPSRIAINRALAVAYENLGDSGTAAVYRQKLDELLAEAGKTKETKQTAMPDIEFDEKQEGESEEDAPSGPEL